MQLHQLKPTFKKKQKKRVGRGGKRGTYSGKGLKGQRSRAGRRMQPLIRQWIKRYPKKRGYRFKRQKPKPVVLNLSTLEKQFNSKETINLQVLIKKRIVHRIKGKIPEVKILARGNLTKPFNVEGCQVSQSARKKIEKAGGRINL